MIGCTIGDKGGTLSFAIVFVLQLAFWYERIRAFLLQCLLILKGLVITAYLRTILQLLMASIFAVQILVTISAWLWSMTTIWQRLSFLRLHFGQLPACRDVWFWVSSRYEHPHCLVDLVRFDGYRRMFHRNNCRHLSPPTFSIK